jgi:hypothetical protein
MLTKEIVNNLFYYKDGVLYWKNICSRRLKTGNIAGYLNENKYWKTSFNKKTYFNHRIIFLMHYGYLPKTIDHINGIKTDNRIENLREVTTSQNQHNRKINLNSSSGVKNVVWSKQCNKWGVFIAVNKKSHCIGYYESLEIAKTASIEARKNYHGEYACHS